MAERYGFDANRVAAMTPLQQDMYFEGEDNGTVVLDNMDDARAHQRRCQARMNKA